MGNDPSGYVAFDQHGYAFIQLMRRSDPGSFGAYYGTYTVTSQPREVVIAVEGSNIPGYIGSTQTRPFRLAGDTLVLGVPGEYQATLVRVSRLSP